MSARATHEVVRTNEGALAVLDVETGEVMHPVIGPQHEAQLLYVAPARLRERLTTPSDAPLRLLDLGLGAASNAIAALSLATEIAARPIEIVSIDKTRAALELALQPDHRAEFGFIGAALDAAQSLCATGVHQGPHVDWRLCLGDALPVLSTLPDGHFDVVFWDPFSPRKNQTLWNVNAFVMLRRVCRAGATVHTYSAATATRSALLLAGFAVGFGPGVAGKQPQTTLAADCLSDLTHPLDQRWLARLARSSAAFPSDAPTDAHARVAALPQFQSAVGRDGQ